MGEERRAVPLRFNQILDHGWWPLWRSSSGSSSKGWSMKNGQVREGAAGLPPHNFIPKLTKMFPFQIVDWSN